MPHIAPFRGLRYQPHIVGSLADVLVPPYDALTDELTGALRARSPWNLIHVEAPDVGRGTSRAAHAAAAATWRSWIETGALAWDAEPGFYVYRHQFGNGGGRLERTGVIAAVALHPWAERVICPHERTRDSWVEARRSLRAACRADLSLGIALVKDPKLRFLALLRAAPRREPPLIVQTDDGAVHRLGRVTDPAWCRAIQERLRYARLYVADGHHRYEAAVRHRADGRSPGSGQVMLQILSTHDPGLLVRPSHQLIHGRQPSDVTAFDGLGATRLDVSPAAAAVAYGGGAEVWLVRRDGVHAFRRDGDGDGDGGEGLSRLAHAVVEAVAPAAAPITTTPHAQVAVQSVIGGQAQAAVLAPALGPGVVTGVADRRRTLPPKSTYFWPKPMAGLVMRTLDPPTDAGRASP